MVAVACSCDADTMHAVAIETLDEPAEHTRSAFCIREGAPVPDKADGTVLVATADVWQSQPVSEVAPTGRVEADVKAA